MKALTSLCIDGGVQTFFDRAAGGAFATGLLVGSVVDGKCFVVHRVALSCSLAERKAVRTACDEATLHLPGGLGVVGIYILEAVDRGGVISLARAAVPLLCGSFVDEARAAAVLVQTSAGRRGVIAKQLMSDGERALDMRVDPQCAASFVPLLASVALARTPSQQFSDGADLHGVVASACAAAARGVRSAIVTASPSTSPDTSSATVPIARFGAVDNAIVRCGVAEGGSGYAVQIYSLGLGDLDARAAHNASTDLLASLRIPTAASSSSSSSSLSLSGSVTCCALLHRSVGASHVAAALADDLVRGTTARFRCAVAGGGAPAAGGRGTLSLPRRTMVPIRGGVWGCRYGGDAAAVGASRTRCGAALGVDATSTPAASAEWCPEASMPAAVATLRYVGASTQMSKPAARAKPKVAPTKDSGGASKASQKEVEIATAGGAAVKVKAGAAVPGAVFLMLGGVVLLLAIVLAMK